MGKVRAGRQHQCICSDRAAEFQRQARFRITVDAPALVRVGTVAFGADDAINGIAGGKNGFPPRFHIGPCVGVAGRIAVAVITVAGQIARCCDLLSPRGPCRQIVHRSGKSSRAVTDSRFRKGNFQRERSFFHVDKFLIHGIVQPDGIVPRFRHGHGNTIAGCVGCRVDKVVAGLRQCSVSVCDF